MGMKLHLLFFRLFNGRKFAAYNGNIHRPLKIQGHAFIHIAAGVFIHDHTWLGAYALDDNIPELRFEEGVCIGHYNHFSCAGKIVFGRNALTADKVFITDNTHAFDRIDVPISQQPIRRLKPVIIGDGAWIGENVSIIGCSIGKNSVIGANSVVTKDIPDYCVAAGNPARILQRYDHATQAWVRVTEN